jgi:hypothetical protein
MDKDNSDTFHEGQIENREWIFNDYTDAYDEFMLDNTTSDGFEDWLRNTIPMISGRVKMVSVSRADRAPERRYELVERKRPGLVLLRVLTQPAGQRLIVYARGPEQTFSDNGHQVQIRYYGLFKDFCLQMARHWSKPISNDFRQERDHYPDNHAIWKQFIQIQSLPYLERPTAVESVTQANSIKGDNVKSRSAKKDRETIDKLLKALIADHLHCEDKKKYTYTKMEDVVGVKTNARTLRDYRSMLGKTEYALLESEAKVKFDDWLVKRQKTA